LLVFFFPKTLLACLPEVTVEEVDDIPAWPEEGTGPEAPAGTSYQFLESPASHRWHAGQAPTHTPRSSPLAAPSLRARKDHDLLHMHEQKRQQRSAKQREATQCDQQLRTRLLLDGGKSDSRRGTRSQMKRTSIFLFHFKLRTLMGPRFSFFS